MTKLFTASLSSQFSHSLTSIFRTAAFLLVVSSTACSSAKEEQPAPVGKMTWYVSDTTQALDVVAQARTLGNGIEITATADPGTTISRTVRLYVPRAVVGDYIFSPFWDAFAVYSVTTNSKKVEYWSGTHPSPSVGNIPKGHINVTALTATSIEGEFYFEGNNLEYVNYTNLPVHKRAYTKGLAGTFYAPR